MLHNLSFIIISLLIINSTTSAQERQNRQGFEGGTITGRVFDSASREKIEYANVVLLSSTDNSLVTGTVTNSDGVFLLTGIRPGKYHLGVRFIGFNEKGFDIEISRNNLNHQLGDIFIEAAVINIEDVVVEGERSPVSYQLDKRVIDVDQMPTVMSGNAADVLENVPSITVDIEGNVSLRGSGSFTVLIDGRPSILDAQDALQQIPASSIQYIEIITNPSAKYDPEGTAGIINIIMKKNQNIGMSGIVNANAGLNNKYGGDFLFEYNTGDVKTTFGADYNKRFSPGEGRQEQRFFSEGNTTYLNSTGDREWGRISYGLRGAVEFSLSEKSILNFGGRYGSREMKNNSFENYIRWSDSSPQPYLYLSNGERERSGKFHALNLNFFQGFGQKGHDLKTELTYGYSNMDEYTLSYELSNNDQISGRRTLESGPSTNFRGKLDYTLPLGEKAKFEAGVQGETDKSVENTEFHEYDTETNNYELNPLYVNSTDYNRRELALYSIFSNEFGNLGIQGGLRTEYTYRDIEVQRQSRRFTIDRWDFFPTIHSSYKISQVNQLMASYTRRIERPRGWQLEPFDTWMDANNVRRGNPALEPQFIDSYELGFQTILGKVVFSSEVYYKVTHNKIERIRSVYSENENVTLNTTDNVGKDYSLGSELMFIFDPANFWTVNLMGNLYDYRIKGVLYDEPFSRKSFNWNSRLNNVFKLSNVLQLQFNLNYNSPSVSSQGRREGFISADVAAKQDLFDRALSLTLQVRNLFGTAKHEFTSEGRNLYSYSYFTREAPMVMLNLRFNFNNFRPQRERDRPDGGFDEGEEF